MHEGSWLVSGLKHEIMFILGTIISSQPVHLYTCTALQDKKKLILMYKFVQTYTGAYTACVHATSYIWSSAKYSHVTQYQVLHMMDTQTWALTYI